MSIQKALDHAIMLQETESQPNTQAGYCIGDRVYTNYLSNACWETFKLRMQNDNPVAYEMYTHGGGKELEERKSGRYTYPPKMASFGSSSRMIYNLMKATPRFLFEKKLPTTIGGTANLDGFIETEQKCIFVEAKCREPYAETQNAIADKYRSLYEAITNSANNNLTCDIGDMAAGKMQVRFLCDETHIQNFDIKQMICHLLGIATAYLQGKYEKPIDFIYLLYNPTGLVIEDGARQRAINDIYLLERNEGQKIDFDGLFYDILVYLQTHCRLGADMDIAKIAAGFSFRICDQHTMCI